MCMGFEMREWLTLLAGDVVGWDGSGSGTSHSRVRWSTTPFVMVDAKMPSLTPIPPPLLTSKTSGLVEGGTASRWKARKGESFPRIFSVVCGVFWAKKESNTSTLLYSHILVCWMPPPSFLGTLSSPSLYHHIQKLPMLANWINQIICHTILLFLYLWVSCATHSELFIVHPFNAISIFCCSIITYWWTSAVSLKLVALG